VIHSEKRSQIVPYKSAVTVNWDMFTSAVTVKWDMFTSAVTVNWDMFTSAVTVNWDMFTSANSCESYFKLLFCKCFFQGILLLVNFSKYMSLIICLLVCYENIALANIVTN